MHSVLQVTTRALTNESRYRVRMALGSYGTGDSSRVAGALTDFVVSVVGMTTGERSGVRQSMSTDASGNLAVELRGAAALIASSLLSGLFQPLLESYASDAMHALPRREQREGATIGIDIWRIHPVEGGIVLGVFLPAETGDTRPPPDQGCWYEVAPTRSLSGPRRLPSDFYRRETLPEGIAARRERPRTKPE